VQVAKKSQLSEEAAGQVLFRQGDSPMNVYVLLSGQVETRLFKAESSQGEASPKSGGMPSPKSGGVGSAASPSAGYRKAPTPRTTYKARELLTLSESRRRNQDTAVDKNGKAVRFKTCDGGSTFNAASTIGDQLNVLQPGAICGDGALHDGTGIQTTIRCLVDCEFIVIPGDIYRRTIKPKMTKTNFINQHVPGAKVEYAGRLDIHPGCFWREDNYPEGHGFLFEGINAEPSIFVVGPGSRVDFRRYRCPDDNPAYILANRPLSAPTGEIYTLKGSTSAPTLWPGGTGGFSQSAPASPAGGTQTFPGGSGLLALPQEADVRWQDGGEATLIQGTQPSGEMGTYDSLGEGAIFCSLAVLPVSACEPFTAVAAGPNCKVYSLAGADIQRLLPNFLRGLRGVLIKPIMRRFHKFMEQHPDAFTPPPMAPKSKVFGVELAEKKVEEKEEEREDLFARAAKLEQERRALRGEERAYEQRRKAGLDYGEIARSKKPAWMKAHEKAADRARLQIGH